MLFVSCLQQRICWLRMTWTCGGTSNEDGLALQSPRPRTYMIRETQSSWHDGESIDGLDGGRRSCAQVFAVIRLRQGLSMCKVADIVHMLCVCTRKAAFCCVSAKCKVAAAPARALQMSHEALERAG